MGKGVIKELTPIIGILCLTILGVIIAVTQPNAITHIMIIVGLICSILGVGSAIAIPSIINRIKRNKYK